MKKEMVLHIPMSQYAFGMTEDRIVIRLRAARGDLKSCSLFYGDTACRQNPILFYEEKMEVVARDEFFDYYEADFTSRFKRIYYYFELRDEVESIYYYSDFFHKELVIDRSEYYKIPFNRREDIALLPEWVKDAVIYNIFPDSFANGKTAITGAGISVPFQNNEMEKAVTVSSKLGGTIAGIEANLEYFLALGVNCIYINPIFAAGEYHKYDTLDYFQVDPCFGTNEEFKEMVTTFHKHDIRVIIDGVFNHCGWKFFAFEDVVQRGKESPYADWFYGLTYPVTRPENQEEIPSYECFAYERLMPKLNTSNVQVREYLCRVGKFWVQEFDIDGWRLDVASEVDDFFWREFRKAVKAVKPDCFIVGEVWESAGHWLYGDMFDSTMNYDLRKHCKYFFAEGKIDSAGFESRVTNMLMRYKKQLLFGQMNLLDSHDVSRFLSVCGEDRERFKLAVIFQMLFVGAPSIFYGDEQGFCGTIEDEYRQKMQFQTEEDLFVFYKRLISIRKKYSCVRNGDFRTVYAAEGSGLYAFERSNSEESITGNCQKGGLYVILNAGEKSEPIPSKLLSGNPIMTYNVDRNKVGSKGYAIIEKR